MPEGSPTHAERARTLVHGRDVGALATLALDPPGFPFASHVIYALHDRAPVLLISQLAEHTKNLAADPRASLLVVEAGGDADLALARATLIGPCRPAADPEAARRAFVSAHPSAAAYSGWADFEPFVLAVEHVRYVGGFGRMSWIDADAWTSAEPDPLAPAADGILAHMNEDHADACLAYARAFGGVGGAASAVMTAVDRYGFDLLATDDSGASSTARVAFDEDVTTPQAARTALVALVKRARAALQG